MEEQLFSISDLFVGQEDPEQILHLLAQFFGPPPGYAQMRAVGFEPYKFFTTIEAEKRTTRSSTFDSSERTDFSIASTRTQTRLPDSLWIQIFKCLAPHLPDVLRCSRVCHLWNALITESVLPEVTLFSRKNLLPAPRSEEDAIQLAIKSRGEEYYAVRARNWNLESPRPFITSTLMKHLYKQLAPTLTDVSFHGLINQCDCASCRRRNYAMKELGSMSAFSSLAARPLFDRAIILLERCWERRCRMDEHLSMGLDAEFSQLVMSTPNLRYLNLVDVEVGATAAEEIARAVGGRLKSLVAGEYLLDHDISRWMPHFKSLVHIAVGKGETRRDSKAIQFLDELLGHLPPSTEYIDFGYPLNICSADDAGANALASLSTKCPRLRYLSVGVMERLSVGVLSKLLEAKKLEVLQLELNSPAAFRTYLPFALVETGEQMSKWRFSPFPKLRKLRLSSGLFGLSTEADENEVGRLIEWITAGGAVAATSSLKKIELNVEVKWESSVLSAKLADCSSKGLIDEVGCSTHTLSLYPERAFDKLYDIDYGGIGQMLNKLLQ